MSVAEGKRYLDLSVAWHFNARCSRAILDVEDKDAIDGGGKEILGVLGDTDGGTGTLHIELASPDALVGVVHGDLAVIGAGEEEVSVLVMDDLADRSGMPRHVEGLHGRVSFRGHFLN